MKRLFGIILILVGAFIFAVLLSGLSGMSSLFSKLVYAMGINNGYQWGIFFGTIVTNGTIGVTAYFIFKRGLALWKGSMRNVGGYGLKK